MSLPLDVATGVRIIGHFPELVDAICARIALFTEGFVNSTIGNLLLAIVLFGPVAFLPQVWRAWTAPDIDALRTPTWSLLLFVNVASFLCVVHNGDWRTRLAGFLWVIETFAICLAIHVRQKTKGDP